MALNAIEWARADRRALPAVPLARARWSNRIDIYFWAYAGVNALYFAKSFATILVAARTVHETGVDMITRAILIAAGRGKRLGAHTDEIPKCMVEVAGQPILGWVWNALSSVGVDELVVIRGYRGDVLEPFVRSLVPDATFVDNPEWQTNNVLLSLACARALPRSPDVPVTYSDIIFTPAVARGRRARRPPRSGS